jgi:hypothetical protein
MPHRQLAPFKAGLLLLIVFTCLPLLIGDSHQPVNAQERTTKKLIEFGWDNPSARYLRENLATFEQSPFDGVTVRLEAGERVFLTEALPESVFEADRADLSAISFTTLTDNFVLMWATMDEGWNWFNDAHIAATEANMRQFVRTARIAGFKGILWDAESYGWSPWEYDAARFGGRSFAEAKDRARYLGRRFVEITAEELPGARILSIWLMSIVADEAYYHGDAPEEGGSALYPAFIEGMFAADADAQIIDGNESSYYYTRPTEFHSEVEWLRNEVNLLDPAYQEAVSSELRFGQALYVDGVLDLWRSPRFFGYYLPDDAARLQLLEQNLYWGLVTTNEYLWVYSENMHWWEGRIPPGLAETVLRVKAMVNSGTPLQMDITATVEAARVAFDQRVTYWGELLMPDGERVLDAEVLSGIVNADGGESACLVYSLNQFTCIFPPGWSGTVIPVLEGAQFDPPSVQINVGEPGRRLVFTRVG